MSRSRDGTWLTTFSPIRTKPDEIDSRPATIRSAVVLPHPDGPTSTMNSPSPMSRRNSSTAFVPSAYTLLTLSNSTPAIALQLAAYPAGSLREPDRCASGICRGGPRDVFSEGGVGISVQNGRSPARTKGGSRDGACTQRWSSPFEFELRLAQRLVERQLDERDEDGVAVEGNDVAHGHELAQRHDQVGGRIALDEEHVLLGKHALLEEHGSEEHLVAQRLVEEHVGAELVGEERRHEEQRHVRERFVALV